MQWNKLEKHRLLTSLSSTVIELRGWGWGFITSTTKDIVHGNLSKHTDEIPNKFIFILDISEGGQMDTPPQLLNILPFIHSFFLSSFLQLLRCYCTETRSLIFNLKQKLKKDYTAKIVWLVILFNKVNCFDAQCYMIFFKKLI